MLQTVIDRIVTDVWSHPESDRHFVVKPVRLTDDDGAIDGFQYPLYSHVRFPIQGKRFAVYQLGQIDPRRFGIDIEMWAWNEVPNISADTGNIFQMFINHRQLNLDGMYITRTRERALLLAIDYERHRDLLRSDSDVYFRVYMNSFYQNTNEPIPLPVYTGAPIVTLQDAANLITIKVNSPADKTMLFHRGYLKDQITVGEVEVGDDLHLWRDDTLTSSFEFTVSDLRYYMSTENNRRYYIIQNPDDDTVRYLDDAEFYLIGKQTVLGNVEREVGVFMPRFSRDDIRNLTHCDYVIDSAYIDNLMGQHPDVDFSAAKVRVMVRLNDDTKPIRGDGAYLRHLYRLPSSIRIDLLTGTSSGIPFWNADTLEDSEYLKLMADPNEQLNIRLRDGAPGFKDVLSYFGVADILERNRVEDGDFYYSPIDKDGAYYLAYSQNGALLGPGVRNVADPEERVMLSTHQPGYKYRTFGGIIEPGAALLSYDPTDDFLDDFASVRYYRVTPESPWLKAIEGDNYTVGDDKKVTWEAALASVDRDKRTAKHLYPTQHQIHRDQIGEPIDIALLVESNPAYNDFGWAGLEIYFANRFLVKDVDYAVDYPTITLRNLEYLDSAVDSFELLVLRHGLPAYADETYPDAESGWITNGEMSRDGDFDFFLDSHSDLYIGGRYVLPDEVRVAETGLGTMPPWVNNGMTYSVVPRVVHSDSDLFRDLTEGRSVAYSKLQLAENALNLLLPEPAGESPVVILGKHELVSVLLNKIVRDLDANTLTVFENMTEDQVRTVVSNYDSYKDLDLATDDQMDDFVVYRPTSSRTTFTVSAIEYRFIEQVNEYILSNRVQLNTGLTIGNN